MIRCESLAIAGTGKAVFVPEGRHSTHISFPTDDMCRLIVPVERKFWSPALRILLYPKRRMFYRARHLTKAVTAGRRHGFIEGPLMDKIREVAGIASGHAVMLCGERGRYCTHSVLLLSDRGEAHALAKVSTTDVSRARLVAEQQWLERLGRRKVLQGRIPKVIGAAWLRNGPYVLVQSVGTGSVCTGVLGPEHARFLSMLQGIDPQRIRFRDSLMWRAMMRRLSVIHHGVPRVWNRRLRRACAVVRDRLGDVVLPMVIAHRDFTKWNIRFGSRGIFVFDWERASEGYLPLYDLFHFVFARKAVKGTVSIRFVAKMKQKIVETALRLEHGAEKAKAVDEQMLAYFVDMCLFRIERHQCRIVGDRVINQYGLLIDRYVDKMRRHGG